MENCKMRVASGRIRTHDTLYSRQMPYQLSYQHVLYIQYNTSKLQFCNYVNQLQSITSYNCHCSFKIHWCTCTLCNWITITTQSVIFKMLLYLWLNCDPLSLNKNWHVSPISKTIKIEFMEKKYLVCNRWWWLSQVRN